MVGTSVMAFKLGFVVSCPAQDQASSHKVHPFMSKCYSTFFVCDAGDPMPSML